MKITKIILAAFAATAFASGQTASSDVVGYVSLGASTGDAVPANTEVTISIPFVQKSEGSYTVASSTATSITVNETLTAGDFDAPTTGAPYMVEISSGTDEGIFAIISSNTADTFTLSGLATESFSGLTADDSITIRKAWTVSTVFGDSLPDNTFVTTYDNTGVNSSATTQYIISQGNWFDATTFTLSNDVVLYPGESYLYINNSSTPVSDMIISGVVPTSKSRAIIAKDTPSEQETRFGYVGPVAETLEDSSLSSILTDNDVISFFDNDATGINKSAAQQYILSGGNWFNATTFSLSNDVELQPGQGYLIRRLDTNTSSVIFTDTQTYIPNL